MVAMSGSGQLGAARDPERIRADIARARAEIAASVDVLTREVSARTDWREWVRRRPGLCLGAAFMLGFTLATRE